MPAVRDGDRDRQTGLAQVGDGGSERRVERSARDQAVAIVDVVAEAGGPAGGIHPGRHRQVVSVVPAHPREVGSLAGGAVVGPVVDDVADDLDAGRGAPQPRSLRRERAASVEADAAIPGGQRGATGRSGHRRAGRGAGRQAECDRQDQACSKAFEDRHRVHRAPIRPILQPGLAGVAAVIASRLWLLAARWLFSGSASGRCRSSRSPRSSPRSRAPASSTWSTTSATSRSSAT